MSFPFDPVTLLCGHLYALHYPQGSRLVEGAPQDAGRLPALVAGHAALHEGGPAPDSKHLEAHLRAATALDPEHAHHPDELVRRAFQLKAFLGALTETARSAAGGDPSAVVALTAAFTPDRVVALCEAASLALASAPADQPDRRSSDWLAALLDPR